MQPIPIKVKNVTLYKYFDPNIPLTEVIFTGGSGTYSVGTLLRSSFYNLDIDNMGKKENPLNVNDKYYAIGETESGHQFQTPWMLCLDNSDQPKFGRTITLGLPEGEVVNKADIAVDSSQYITLSPLSDLTVSQLFTPPAIGQIVLIEQGKGNVIATRTGTPHEMGVEVTSGDRDGDITPGMKNIIITGKIHLANGEVHPFSQQGYTVVSGGKTAIFLKEFF